MKFLITTILMVVLLAGCATSKMTNERTLVDGKIVKVKYTVEVNSFGQDFKGSDLSASLNPEGETMIKAGAVDASASQVTADVAASMVELIKAMLPYLVPPTP